MNDHDNSGDHPHQCLILVEALYKKRNQNKRLQVDGQAYPDKQSACIGKQHFIIEPSQQKKDYRVVAIEQYYSGLLLCE